MDTLRGPDFVSLTTFRRDGRPVPTPMWFALEGDEVLFSTPAGAGKLKRLRHTSRVVLQPCSRRGALLEGSRPIEATARIVTDPAERRRIEDALGRTYGWQWRFAVGFERLASRVRRREPKPRVAIVATRAQD